MTKCCNQQMMGPVCWKLKVRTSCGQYWLPRRCKPLEVFTKKKTVTSRGPSFSLYDNNSTKPLGYYMPLPPWLLWIAISVQSIIPANLYQLLEFSADDMSEINVNQLQWVTAQCRAVPGLGAFLPIQKWASLLHLHTLATKNSITVAASEPNAHCELIMIYIRCKLR